MSTWEELRVSQKEMPRAGLVKAALARQITNRQGAEALRLTIRQFRRLKRRYEAEGAAGLLHRLRGRPSPRALEIELRDRVAELMQTTYRGLNDCHLTEKLQEVEQLAVSRSSVTRIRRALGLPAKHRRRPRQHRARRPPAARLGALVLLDGSQFDWLGTGLRFTLLGAIDDATGTVLSLHFRLEEDLHGYLTLLAQLAGAYGLPVALYGDRLAVFVRNDPHWTLPEQLQGAQHPTHFGQVLRDLGIGYIPAGSPQAKGRIERLWKTMQDRLVAELRLAGITTFAAAQAFLPAFLADYNRRFAHPPAEARPAWRRPPRELADLLSCRYLRTVAGDNTVRLGARWLQIPPGPRGRGYVRCRVEVRECLDGRLLVVYQARRLAVGPAPPGEFTLVPRHGPTAHRLRAAQSASEPGGRYLPTQENRPTAAALAHLAALARDLRRRPAAAHPWRRRPFSRREAQRQRPTGGTFSRTN
jgi:transposase